MLARMLALSSIVALGVIASAEEIPNLTVLELKGGAEGTRPYGLTPFRGKLLFCGEETSSTIRLWSTDGTAAGTVPLSPEGVDFRAVQRIDRGIFYPLGDRLMTFVHRQPWVTDGTPEGTHQLATNLEYAGPSQPYLPSGFAMLDGYAYMAGRLNSLPYVRLVRSRAPFTNWEMVGGMIASIHEVDLIQAHGRYVYFTSMGGIFRVGTDGTMESFSSFGGDGRTIASTPEEIAFFSTQTTALGSPFGAALIFDESGLDTFGDSERCLNSFDLDIVGKPQPSDYQIGVNTGATWLRLRGNTVPIQACDHEPCTTCGMGGQLIASRTFNGERTYPFSFYFLADYFTRVGNQVIFAGNWDYRSGVELIATDGTMLGTHLVTDINPAGNASLRSFKAIGDKLLFEANDGASGMEPWITDGTAAGTYRLVDLAPGATDSEDLGYGENHRLREFAVANGRLFITGQTADTGMELWAVPAGPLGLDASASTDLVDPILARYDTPPSQIADANGDSVVDAADVKWVTP